MKIEIAHKLPESGRGRKSHAGTRLFWVWLVCGWLTCVGTQVRAATYVIKTDEEPLTSEESTTLGTRFPAFLLLTPTVPGTINGTPVRFAGYTNSGPNDPLQDTAVFAVFGDFVLRTNDAVYGIGTNFLRIDVAGDATIPAGARMSVEGLWTSPGAGGGAGGIGGTNRTPIQIGPTSCNTNSWPLSSSLGGGGGSGDTNQLGGEHGGEGRPR